MKSRAAYALRMPLTAPDTRLGTPAAIAATAHKLARNIYHLIKTGAAYDDIVFAFNEVLYKQRNTAHLRKRARELGFTLIPLPVQGEVS